MGGAATPPPTPPAAADKWALLYEVATNWNSEALWLQ